MSLLLRKGRIVWLGPCKIPYVGEYLLEKILILNCRHGGLGWSVLLINAFNFPIVTTRYPFAAGWSSHCREQFQLLSEGSARTIEDPLNSQAL